MTGEKIPSAETLVPDSRFIGAERHLQPKFSLARLLLLITLPFFLLVASDTRFEGPDRAPAPEREAAVRFEPLSFRAPLSGVWRVSVADPRFGGLSALTLENGRLAALTDSGVVVTLPRPGGSDRARLQDLPAGPGSPWLKRNRDSEALVRTDEGWWVGFENRHSLWLFDPALRRPLRSLSLGGLGWKANAGIEAMVGSGDGLTLLPESGREVVRVRGKSLQRITLSGSDGAPSDATRLPDGAVLVTLRSFHLTGIRNRIARLERASGGYRLQPLLTLPLGMFDNVEGIAAEPRGKGAIRLWMITDNDFTGWRDTKLIALDLPVSRSR